MSMRSLIPVLCLAILVSVSGTASSRTAEVWNDTGLQALQLVLEFSEPVVAEPVVGPFHMALPETRSARVTLTWGYAAAWDMVQISWEPETASLVGTTWLEDPVWHADENVAPGGTLWLSTDPVLDFGVTEVAPAIGPDGTVYSASIDALTATASGGRSSWEIDVAGLSSGLDESALLADEVSTELGLDPGGIAVGADGTVYVVSQSQWRFLPEGGGCSCKSRVEEHSYVEAVNPDGSPGWYFPVDGTRAHAPVIADGAGLIVATAGGIIHGVAFDGAERWRTDVGAEVAIRPVVSRDGATIYILCGSDKESGSVIALDSAGRIDWSVPFDHAPAAAAVDDAGTLHVVTRGRIYRVSATGAVLGVVEMPELQPARNGLAIGSDGTAYVGATGGLYAVSRSGHVAWTFPMAWAGYPSVGDDEAVYFVGRTERPESRFALVAVDAQGQALWDALLPAAATGVSAPVLGPGGILYCSATSDQGLPFQFGAASHLLAIKTGSGALSTAGWPCFQGDARRSGQ